MSKREVPEINAGSMADIAFLLLIFFLVTTTMDKDTAYLVKMAKPLEVPIEVEIQKNNVLSFRINANQDLQVGFAFKDSVVEYEDIHKVVTRFYMTNRDKVNDVNFPFYSRGTETQFSNELSAVENQIKGFEEKGDDAMVEYLESAEAGWLQKINAVRMYSKASGKKVMPEIHPQAHIKIEPQKNTNNDAYVAVISEINLAIMNLRNAESKEMFGITYTDMEKYVQLNATKANDDNIVTYKKQMELLDFLFPKRIIEIEPKV